MYAATDKGSQFARQRAEEYFAVMNDPNASIKQRAETAGVGVEEYRRGDALADMTNYVLMEAYSSMMDLPDVVSRKNYYADILQGLDRLVGVDNLTQEDVNHLKKMWKATAGTPGEESLNLTPDEKAKIEVQKARIEAARKAKEQGRVPAEANDPGAQ